MNVYYEPELVRILMHLNGGYTKVIIERTEGQGLADGGIEWEIPTQKIPTHLRNIGSRFLLIHRADFSKEGEVENFREKWINGIDIQDIQEIQESDDSGINKP